MRPGVIRSSPVISNSSCMVVSRRGCTRRWPFLTLTRELDCLIQGGAPQPSREAEVVLHHARGVGIVRNTLYHDQDRKRRHLLGRP